MTNCTACTMTNAPEPNLLESVGQKARAAAGHLANAATDAKNKALQAIATGLAARQKDVLAANAKDVDAARTGGMAEAQIDRLKLTPSRLQGMIDAVTVIASLPDPVGRVLDTTLRPNGLRIEKRSVPIGVIGIIFESRPNVAIDAAALCLKSGNACILRGGSDSWHSVSLLIDIIRAALTSCGLPADAVQTPPSADRAFVGAMLTLNRYIDLIIPRGGKSLIARVQTESRIPVLSHLDGICHTYVDAEADAKMAVDVVVNAKMRRPSVCGATECLLLHKDIASGLGQTIITALLDAGCEVRAPQALRAADSRIKPVAAGDYGHEFLAPIIAVAVVNDVSAAIAHVNMYGSGHTDAIITNNQATAQQFLNGVNSAIAVHNASTQFADGGEFGKGAEIGIATGRLHARGPVGLEELTVMKYHVRGNGQTRPV